VHCRLRPPKDAEEAPPHDLFGLEDLSVAQARLRERGHPLAKLRNACVRPMFRDLTPAFDDLRRQSLAQSRTLEGDIRTAVATLLGGADRGAVLWQPDSISVCRLCQAHLGTLVRRRHHCRLCGMLVCDGCSKQRLGVDAPSGGGSGAAAAGNTGSNGAAAAADTKTAGLVNSILLGPGGGSDGIVPAPGSSSRSVRACDNCMATIEELRVRRTHATLTEAAGRSPQVRLSAAIATATDQVHALCAAFRGLLAARPKPPTRATRVASLFSRKRPRAKPVPSPEERRIMQQMDELLHLFRVVFPQTMKRERVQLAAKVRAANKVSSSGGSVEFWELCRPPLAPSEARGRYGEAVEGDGAAAAEVGGGGVGGGGARAGGQQGGGFCGGSGGGRASLLEWANIDRYLKASFFEIMPQCRAVQRSYDSLYRSRDTADDAIPILPAPIAPIAQLLRGAGGGSAVAGTAGTPGGTAVMPAAVMGADTKGADSTDWTVVGASGEEDVLQRSAGSPGGAGGGWGERLLRGFGSKKKTLVKKSSGRGVDRESGDVEPADSPQRRRHEDPHEHPHERPQSQFIDTARARQSSIDSMHHAPPNALGGWKSVELLQHSCAILNRVGLELLMLDHLASQMVVLPAAAGRGVGRQSATAETQGQLALDPDVRTHFASAAIHVHGLLETLRGPVLSAHVLAAQSRNRATAVSASGRDVSGGGVDGVVRRIETSVEQLLRSWNSSYPPLLPAVDSLRGAGGGGGGGGSGGGGRAGAAVAAVGGVGSAELVRRSASLEERPLAGGAAPAAIIAAQHGQQSNEEVVESTMRRVRDILTTRVEVAIASPFDGSTAASLDPWIDAWSRLYMLREHLDASIAVCARGASARGGEGVGERQP
jgi:hypothetical protein